MRAVEFYFDYQSPYSYLAQTQLDDVPVMIRPIDVLDVMAQVNNTPTTVTCPTKRDYARTDLARWAVRYQVPFACHARFGQIDGRRLLRATLAAAPAQQRAVSAALFRALWGEHAPLDTAADVVAVLDQAGIDTTSIAPQIDAAAMDAALNAASAAAAQRGVFGAPTFFVGGDMFFGNDRLDFLHDALARAA